MGRITDLSFLSPENFIQTNLTFFRETEYDDYGDPMSTRKEIKRTDKSDLQRVLNQFPDDREVDRQCALWMQAVAGKHFFPDANHRTAIALLKQILRENQILEEWDVETAYEILSESKRARREADITMSDIYTEDELYEVWKSYFEDLF